MKLVDVNVLVAVFRGENPHHDVARRWLERALLNSTQIGLTPAVVSGFVRVVTNTRIHPDATPLELALRQMDELFEQPGVVDALPGPRHWVILADVCRQADARGNLVSDAVIAAVAIEQGATVVTFDRDFARFPGLRWETPDAGK